MYAKLCLEYNVTQNGNKKSTEQIIECADKMIEKQNTENQRSYARNGKNVVIVTEKKPN